MARATRNSKLETKSSRIKLKARHNPYWQTIGRGLALGYRKGQKVTAWLVRIDTGQLHPSGQKKYFIETLSAKPDDFEDQDGESILDYFQAQDKARKIAQGEREKLGIGINPEGYTITEAFADYLAWHKAHGKSAKQTEYVINAHILPSLGEILLCDLKTNQITKWQNDLIIAPLHRRGSLILIDPDDKEALRKRKATANRVLTVLKAGLNHAWNQGRSHSRDAWERVKPFKNADVPKERYLSENECRRLINACDPDFRRLVKAALFTGCRYGELVKSIVKDFNADAGILTIPNSKGGKARHIPLTDEGIDALKIWAAGKLRSENIFIRDDGETWGKSQQSRRIKEASQRAKIDPPCSFHDLRNTYGSILAMKGVPLNVISEALGHADTRMTQRHYAHLQPSYITETIRNNLPSFGSEVSNIKTMK